MPDDDVETTCTDCATKIVASAAWLLERGKKARLCDSCRTRRGERGALLDDLLPAGGLGNYRMCVELQWAIAAEDLEYRAVGDVESDFARRSLETIRPAFSLVAGGGHDETPIGHYHLFVGEDSLRRCLGEPLRRARPTVSASRSDPHDLGAGRDCGDALEQRWTTYIADKRTDVGPSTLLRITAKKAFEAAFETAYVLGRRDEHACREETDG